ncbi:DNA-directed RNA polymerase sigma-70 factor [Dyadobacter beijingensis]|uniref:DNA-directed RNA polymerase sigma-70 factor n=1 Tax=Dyadobacter beijingensis TaxID=365489 RepID=A0ABQ2HV06_9BACT|nr:sigma-70 family RNA polymerase sigma factor [Dyadobacter beijingensis]GGM90177.1 DNA-directed RNA polymerase sigma-70 factor [Dyadobacter beijingensis]
MIRDRLTSQENQSLWDEFRAGNPDAFSRIYELFSADLYRYGYNLVRNKQLVEDCLHELFVHIYNTRQRIGPTDNILYYLYRSLRRRLTDSLARLNKFDSDDYIFEGAEFLVESYETELVEEQTLDRQKQIIIAELNRLPKRQREILYLVYMKGLSYAEAGDVMNIAMSTVYNTVNTALSTLRSFVAQRLAREGISIVVTVAVLISLLTS